MNCLEHILFRTAELVSADAISKAQLQHILRGLLAASLYYPTGIDPQTGKPMPEEPADMIKLNQWMHETTNWFFYPDGLESDDVD